MGRLVLHNRLLDFADNVYFQPPSNIKLVYPCIIYHKDGRDRKFSNNRLYLGKQKYTLTVIDRDPDSVIADRLEDDLQYCYINDHFTVDNLNHTSLTFHYDINTILLGGNNI